VAELGRRIGVGLRGDLREIVEGGEGTGESEGSGAVLGPGEVVRGPPVSPTVYRPEGQMGPRLLEFFAWDNMSTERQRETQLLPGNIGVSHEGPLPLRPAHQSSLR
jgi:hypothetical protein